MSLQTIKDLIVQLNEQEEQEIFEFIEKRIDQRYNKSQICQLLCHEDIMNVRSAISLLDALGFGVTTKVCGTLRVLNKQLILPIHLQSAPHAIFIELWLLAEYCRVSTSQENLKEMLLISSQEYSIELRFKKTHELPDNIMQLFKWTHISNGKISWSICAHGIIDNFPTVPIIQRCFLDFITQQCVHHQWQLTNTRIYIHPLKNEYDFSAWQGIHDIRRKQSATR